MSLFDILRYPLSDPPTRIQLEALPLDILDEALEGKWSVFSVYSQIIYMYNNNEYKYRTTMKRMKKALADMDNVEKCNNVQ